MMNPKNPPLRDPAYLKHLRGERCLITGRLTDGPASRLENVK